MMADPSLFLSHWTDEPEGKVQCVEGEVIACYTAGPASDSAG
jgi:hypothetical protein